MATAPVSIKLRCASWAQLATIYKRDLGRGAIFLKSSRPPPIGTLVQIDMTLPSETMIVLSGVIVEHVGEGGMGGRGPGVDIKLAAIPQSAMWLIETALASQRDAAQKSQQIRAITGSEAPAIEEGADLADAESQLITALAAELASLQKLNPFQVLGVGYEAGDHEVRAAFGELTRRYHPDRYARYPSNELRKMAAEIFILIRDAYRKIGDPHSRAAARPAPVARKSPTKPPPISGLRPAVAAPPVPASRTPTPAVGVPIPPAARKTPPAGIPTIPMPPTSGPTTPPPAHRPSAVTSATLPPATARLMTPAITTVDDGIDLEALDNLLDLGRYDDALALCRVHVKKNPNDRVARSGIELAEGLRALERRDRLEAAQRFESVLELDPSNERAARELAEMRRQATTERKGLLIRLLGKKE